MDEKKEYISYKGRILSIIFALLFSTVICMISTQAGETTQVKARMTVSKNSEQSKITVKVTPLKKIKSSEHIKIYVWTEWYGKVKAKSYLLTKKNGQYKKTFSISEHEGACGTYHILS